MTTTCLSVRVNVGFPANVKFFLMCCSIELPPPGVSGSVSCSRSEAHNAVCHCVECRYGECRDDGFVKIIVFVVNVVFYNRSFRHFTQP